MGRWGAGNPQMLQLDQVPLSITVQNCLLLRCGISSEYAASLLYIPCTLVVYTLIIAGVWSCVGPDTPRFYVLYTCHPQFLAILNQGAFWMSRNVHMVVCVSDFVASTRDRLGRR